MKIDTLMYWLSLPLLVLVMLAHSPGSAPYPTLWGNTEHAPAFYHLQEEQPGRGGSLHSELDKGSEDGKQDVAVERDLSSSFSEPNVTVGNWFYVADGLLVEDVAYNSHNEEYLVAWSVIGGSGYPYLYVRVFDKQGRPLYPTQEIGRRRQAYTRVVYNPYEDVYLVVWDPTGFDLYAQRLTRRGTLLGSSVKIADGVGGSGEGLDVVYCSSRNEYFVLFNVILADWWAAAGQRVTSNGTLAGDRFWIGGDMFLAGDVVYNAQDDVYLVVGQWGGSGSDGWDIYGRFVAPDGQLLGTLFKIEQDANAQDRPLVSWNGADNEYLVIWKDDYEDNGTPDVYGHRLNASGKSVGAYIPVATDSVIGSVPNDLAYKENNGSYLAVWSTGLGHSSATAIKPNGAIPYVSRSISSSSVGSLALADGAGDDYVVAMEVGGGIWGRFIKAWERTSLPIVIRNSVLPIMPNDPYFQSGTQWGLHNTGQSGGLADADVDAPEAWGISTGNSSVIVAVVDSGVDLDHPEFSGRLLAGYDFVNGDNSPDDDLGHGTHVAGIAGAKGNNGIGVAGIAWNVRILPIKVLSNAGSGSVSALTEGIYYAINHGARVINLSLSTGQPSYSVQSAVTYAYGQGALVVAAAGNCGDSNYAANGCDYQDQPRYPAAGSYVLAVAATTQTDDQSSFSNMGSYVDIAAPGSSIYSTGWPGDPGYPCSSGYCSKSGTSMASPLVAGLAGLIFSQYPTYTPDQVAKAIVHNADDLGIAGHDSLYGCGRINAYRSLAVGSLSSGCEGWGGLATVQSVDLSGMSLAETEFRPGVLLVKFQEDLALAERGKTLAVHGLVSLKVIQHANIHLVAVPAGQELAVMEILNADPAVVYAEPDLLVYALP